MLDNFYKVAIIIKIGIDVIQLTSTFYTKYNMFKNYNEYIRHNLHKGDDSDLMNYRPFYDDNF